MKSNGIKKALAMLLTIVMVLGTLSVLPLTISAASNTGSVLYGKKALFVGDSITAGAFDGSANKSWAGRIAQSTGLVSTNGGVSGASISDCRSGEGKSGRVIDQLNQNSTGSFDYVIMHGGVNDAWDMVDVGEVTDHYDVSKLDPSTYVGGLEETFAKAKELFPNATYGFIMNFALPMCPYGNISDMSEYFAGAKEACEKWGVDYLDLYNNTDFCYNVLKVNTSTYFGDTYYCHPNAAGHNLIAPMVEAWMKTLVPKNQTLVNVYDSATATAGHYHPVSNSHSSSNFYTNTFTVAEGNVITFGPSLKSGQDFHVIGYNAEGQIAHTDFQNPGTLTVADDCFRNNYVIYSYTVPANVTNVRLTVSKDMNTVFTATVNQPFDGFAFWEYWNSDPTRAATFLKSTRTDSRQDGYSGKLFAPDYTSSLRGRSVLFTGDSIVSSQRDTSLYYCGWADRIGMVNGMSYVNAGVSTTSFAVANGTAGRIVNQLLARHESSFDYIITNGGVNDKYFYAPIGTMAATKNLADFDISTFAGGLEEYFYKAQEKYPNATIGYILTFTTPNQNRGLEDMTAYYTLAKQICEKWGVYYLDLYNNKELCEEQLQTHTYTYLADGLHPNGAGVDMIYPLIEEWMKTLPVSSAEDEEEEKPLPPPPYMGGAAEKPTEGTGTESDPYIITKGEHYMWISAGVSTWDDGVHCHFKLGNDLNMGGYTIPSIATTPKNFVLDGDNHTVYNLCSVYWFVILNGATFKNLHYVNFQENRPGGLAGAFTLHANNTRFYNVTIDETSMIVGGEDTGAFCSDYGVGTTFENCVNSATVTSNGFYVGGFAGSTVGATAISFINCVNNGDVTSTSTATSRVAAGGFIGYSPHALTAVTFKNCKNTGNITAKLGAGESTYAGGLYGAMIDTSSTVTIQDCINEGTINAKVAGGLCAYIGGKTASVTDCINRGDVYGTAVSSVGKIYAGGLFGSFCQSALELTRCINYGDIITGDASCATQTFVGGLSGAAMGTKLTMDYCANVGNVSVQSTGKELSRIGGIFGTLPAVTNTTYVISNVYNTGNLTVKNNNWTFGGGFCGYYYGTGTLTLNNVFSTGSISTTKSGDFYDALIGPLSGYSGLTVDLINAYAVDQATFQSRTNHAPAYHGTYSVQGFDSAVSFRSYAYCDLVATKDTSITLVTGKGTDGVYGGSACDDPTVTSTIQAEIARIKNEILGVTYEPVLDISSESGNLALRMKMTEPFGFMAITSILDAEGNRFAFENYQKSELADKYEFGFKFLVSNGAVPTLTDFLNNKDVLTVKAEAYGDGRFYAVYDKLNVSNLGNTVYFVAYVDCDGVVLTDDVRAVTLYEEAQSVVDTGSFTNGAACDDTLETALYGRILQYHAAYEAYLESVQSTPTVATGLTPYAGGAATKPTEGTGTESDPFIITKGEHFMWIAAGKSTWNDGVHGHFKLDCDLDMGGYQIGAIGNATNFVLDGANHTVYNLKQNYLIDALNGGAFRNLHYVNFQQDRGAGNTGAFCLNATNVTFYNVSIDETSRISGGLVGAFCARYGVGTTFENCTNAATVTSNVTSTGNYLAGAAGFAASTVDTPDISFINCTNTGTITVNDTTEYRSAAAGFLAMSTAAIGKMTFTNCVNTGAVSDRLGSSTYVGGLLGIITTTATTITVTDCTNRGEISGNGMVGGLFGYIGGKTVNMTDCLNTGTIRGTNRSGGLIGATNQNSLTVQNCMNRGEIIGGYESFASQTFAGGLSAEIITVNLTLDGFANTGDISIQNVSTNLSRMGGVFGTGWQVSGIQYTVSNVYNLGDLTSTCTERSFGGGFCGYFASTGTLSLNNVYSIAKMSSTGAGVNAPLEGLIASESGSASLTVNLVNCYAVDQSYFLGRAKKTPAYNGKYSVHGLVAATVMGDYAYADLVADRDTDIKIVMGKGSDGVYSGDDVIYTSTIVKEIEKINALIFGATPKLSTSSASGNLQLRLKMTAPFGFMAITSILDADTNQRVSHTAMDLYKVGFAFLATDAESVTAESLLKNKNTVKVAAQTYLDNETYFYAVYDRLFASNMGEKIYFVAYMESDFGIVEVSEVRELIPYDLVKDAADGVLFGTPESTGIAIENSAEVALYDAIVNFCDSYREFAASK